MMPMIMPMLLLLAPSDDCSLDTAADELGGGGERDDDGGGGGETVATPSVKAGAARTVVATPLAARADTSEADQKRGVNKSEGQAQAMH